MWNDEREVSEKFHLAKLNLVWKDDDASFYGQNREISTRQRHLIKNFHHNFGCKIISVDYVLQEYKHMRS